jgi:AraC family transcriptional regulator of adaptative response / DNA-3-methyladenine glycosylase II
MIAMDLDRAGDRAVHAPDAGSGDAWSAPVTVRLPFVGPYDWPAMIGFLGRRAIPGVESAVGDRYRRTIELGGRHGTIDVGLAAGGQALEATIAVPDTRSVAAIVERIGRLFDLAADIETIGAHLARDPELAPLVNARPALRVPGAWDGFELAVRGILGQQITVGGARMLAGRLVERHGQHLRVDRHDHGLTAVFPGPGALRDADLAALGMPGARGRALSNLAAAAAAEPDLFEPRQGLERAVARLRALPGIGEWTAQYIAMRAMREPDAFPAADVGLLRAVTRPGGSRPTPADLLARAEGWRPWRAYAALHLWASLPAGGRA